MTTRNVPIRLDTRTLPAIAHRMKLLRLTTGLSVSDFAREAGFARTMWHNIEAGVSRIGIDAAIKLCDQHHITLDWIYRGHDAMLPYGFAKRLQEAEKTGVEDQEQGVRQSRDG
jgi:transcriptional regulator with XRE-family HTH domain